jgi:alcohol dehydrogenase class IV
MRFEMASPGRILFGPGVAVEAGPAAASMGQRAFVVTGRDSSRVAVVTDALRSAGVDVILWATSGEPTVSMARGATAAARDAACDIVVAIGGGSALDLGKAVAGLLGNDGDPLDYLEVIGRGQPLTLPAAPFIAMPTTAGTGAEATRNAVLASPEHGVKASLRSPCLLPRLALVDPDLTIPMPPDVTATTGMDALTQLIEPFTCLRAQPFTDAICREGIVLAVRSLRAAFRNGADRAAREDMAVASLFGGMALANAGLGAVHGFAAAIGGRFAAPHGAVCARMLAPVMAANIEALHLRAPDSPILSRYDAVGRMLTGQCVASAADGVAAVAALCDDLGIPPLSRWGVNADDISGIVEATTRASSTKANPVVLTPDELQAALESAV